jgi:hypothetical protein
MKNELERTRGGAGLSQYGGIETNQTRNLSQDNRSQDPKSNL